LNIDSDTCRNDLAGKGAVMDVEEKKIPLKQVKQVNYEEIESSCYFKYVERETKRFFGMGAELVRRKVPRGIYQMVVCSVAVDLIEIRMLELWDVVDVFVFGEGPKSNSGIPKPEYVKESLDRFERFKEKFIYVSFDCHNNGESRWTNENCMMNMVAKIGLLGMANNTNMKDDDLVFIHHCDEIPQPGLLKVFKYYDGFPDENIQISYRWITFNFAWTDKRNFARYAGTTYEKVKEIFKNVGSTPKELREFSAKKEIGSYIKSYKKHLHPSRTKCDTGWHW